MEFAVTQRDFRAMPHWRAIATPLVALTVSMSLPCAIVDAAAQTRFGQITYTTQTICEAANVLSGEECKNAFVNANAELDEKAPRFDSRGECERFFHRCMIGDIGGAVGRGKGKPRVTFIPALKTILISGSSSAERGVLPQVEGDEAEGLFQVRAIDHLDNAESGAKTRRAQETWAQRRAAAAAPPVSVDPVYAPGAGETDSEPKRLDPACASLVDPFAYNACLARGGSPRLK
jgi:hypothetical protein